MLKCNFIFDESLQFEIDILVSGKKWKISILFSISESDEERNGNGPHEFDINPSQSDWYRAFGLDINLVEFSSVLIV